MVKVVYHPRLAMGFPGLGLLHPFDGYRPLRVYRSLLRHRASSGLACRDWCSRPEAASDDSELALVHDPDYLASLRRPAVLARAFEVSLFAWTPIAFLNWIALTPMRWACAAALLGARQALDQGMAVSLGGGHHHAKPAGGEGFCVLADVAYLVARLRQEKQLQRVLYVDLDAHQGNGVAHCFAHDPSVKLFDMYNSKIYPLQDGLGRQRLDVDLPLEPGCQDQEYLAILQAHLPQFLDQPADLLIYNAGSDVLACDPLGGLGLTPQGVLQRDLLVFAEAQRRALPILSLPSGGYSPESARVITRTIVELWARYPQI